MRRSIPLLLAAAGAAMALQTASAELDWQGQVVVASGEARVGPWRMNRSDWAYVDDPTVAIAADGTATVAWVDQAHKDVFLQRYDAAGEALLPRPVNVSRSPEIFSWLPRVVTADGDPPKLYVLWQEIIFSGGSHGGDILFARSTDGGQSFEEPLNLSMDTAGSGKGRLTEARWDNGSLDLAQGADGRLYATWTDYEGSLWFSRSTDQGRTFSEPEEIVASGATVPARGPALAVQADDVVYLAWSVGEGAQADLQLVRSTDGGRTFSEPRVVQDTDGHSDAPKLVAGREGGLHIFYAQSDAQSDQEGRGGEYHVAYTRLPRWGAAFTEPVDLSPSQSADETSASYPSAAEGREGHLYVLWELIPQTGGQPRGLGYTRSTDNGMTWSAPAVVPGSLDPDQGFNGSLQGSLMQKLATDRNDTIAVVNSAFRSGEGSLVWLLRAHER